MRFSMELTLLSVDHRTPKASAASEFLKDRAEFLSRRLGHGFGPMRLQDVAQTGVDPLDQILIGQEPRVQGKLGAEIATVPVVLPGVVRGVALRQVVAPEPDGAGEFQRQVLVIDGDSLPEAAEHAGGVVA